MNHKKVYQKRLQSLDKGKAKSLGPVEKLTMRYAGWVDGRHGLLRCENGTWQSSVLKQEVDSYEEFCAGQMGRLKFEEEDEFKKLNILFRYGCSVENKSYCRKAGFRERPCRRCRPHTPERR